MQSRVKTSQGDLRVEVEEPRRPPTGVKGLELKGVGCPALTYAGFVVPLVCQDLGVADQSSLSLVCKEFTDVLRLRPDEERLVNYIQYILGLAKSRKLPYFCYVPGVDYVQQQFTARRHKVSKQGLERPLWLLGAIHTDSSLALQRVRSLKGFFGATLRNMLIEEATFHVDVFESLPLVNELELRGCTVSASALAPLRSVKIKLLTAEECVVSAGGVIDIAALAVLFGETLEYLSIGGRGRHVHQAPSILNVKMLNRAKRLEKLKLNRFVVPNASVPAGLLPAHLVGQVGSQKLNLPLLRRVQISMVTGFTFNLLRNCRALEIVDLNYSLNDLFRFPPATTNLPEVREWRICDLPKLTELQVTYSEPNMTKSPRISACLKRKADGTLDEVELRSFRFRDNDLGLYGETVFLKTCYDWILNHGILREYEFGLRRLHTLNDADISYRHLTRFLNNSPLLESIFVDLHGLASEFDFPEEDLYDWQRAKYPPPRKAPMSKPWHETYPCTCLHLHMRKGNPEVLFPFFQRMRLRDCWLAMQATVKGRTTMDYSWLHESAPTLEALRISTFVNFAEAGTLGEAHVDYWLEPRINARLQVAKFQVLESLSLRYQRLSWGDVEEIGRLPLLNKLVLQSCYFEEDSEDMMDVEKKGEMSGQANSPLFPSLRKAYLYDLNIQSGKEFPLLRKLMGAHQLETVAMPWIEPTCKLANCARIGWKMLLEGINLRSCVSLDLSGCVDLTSLRAVDAPLLETLMLNACYGLQSLKGISKSQRLKVLSLRGCQKLKTTKPLAGLNRLEVVLFEGCHLLTLKNFEFVKQSTTLKYLNVVGCNRLLALDELAQMVRDKPFQTILHCGRNLSGNPPDHVRVFYYFAQNLGAFRAMTNGPDGFTNAGNGAPINPMDHMYFEFAARNGYMTPYLPRDARYGTLPTNMGMHAFQAAMQEMYRGGADPGAEDGEPEVQYRPHFGDDDFLDRLHGEDLYEYVGALESAAGYYDDDFEDDDYDDDDDYPDDY